MRKSFAVGCVVTAGIAILLAACREADDAAPAPQPTVTPTVVSGGGSPPEYLQPVPLVPGEYKPPSASQEAWDKWAKAVDASRGKPQFNGVVNGFRIYGWKDAAEDPALEQKECVSVEFPEVDLLEFTYLPPGTALRSPQYAGVCADGSTAWVNQEFELPAASFSIGYELGERAIGTDAAAERVSAATVAGQPGVIIRPLIEEGNGQSIVAFTLGKGFIVLGASELPISETINIAEGVRCESC